MSAISEVLLAIASEIVEKAKSSLPKLRNGEQIRREWFENDTYYRETTYDGKVFQSHYNFILRSSSK